MWFDTSRRILTHPITIIAGVLRDQCRDILLQFFEKQLGKKSVIWEDIELPVA